MVKDGAVVVDVGITRDLNGIRGDVKYDEVSKKHHISHQFQVGWVQ